MKGRIAKFFERAVSVTLTVDPDRVVFWSAMGMAGIAAGLGL